MIKTNTVPRSNTCGGFVYGGAGEKWQFDQIQYSAIMVLSRSIHTFTMAIPESVPGGNKRTTVSSLVFDPRVQDEMIRKITEEGYGSSPLLYRLVYDLASADSEESGGMKITEDSLDSSVLATAKRIGLVTTTDSVVTLTIAGKAVAFHRNVLAMQGAAELNAESAGTPTEDVLGSPTQKLVGKRLSGIGDRVVQGWAWLLGRGS